MPAAERKHRMTIEGPAAERGDSLLRSKSFLVVWLGQLVSVLGTKMTSFALVIWVFRKTGAVTPVALVAFFVALPSILISPLAGALADRWSRRLVMIVSDLGAGLTVLAVALLLFTGHLQVWHIYVSSAVAALFTTFQWPAYSAAITLLVPKHHLARASGLVQTSQGIGQLLSPLIAGFLVVTIGISGVIVIDFASFLFAVVTLLLVRFPSPPRTAAGAQASGSIWKEAAFGWSYIRSRRGLIGLLLLFVATNFVSGFVLVLAAPYLLSFASAAVWGVVSTVGGTGMLVGGLLMSTWGGPRRKMYGILAFEALSGLCILLAGAIPSPVLFAAAAFGFFLSLPVITSCSQAIWQSKVEPDVQGKVFAIRAMIASSCTPIAYLLAGPLADRLFEPWMAPGGALAATMGRLIGTGPGRGIGLLCCVLGLVSLLVAAIGYVRLRFLEDQIPDAISEQLPAVAEVS
jgi:Major Facilitator Superfamily